MTRIEIAVKFWYKPTSKLEYIMMLGNQSWCLSVNHQV